MSEVQYVDRLLKRPKESSEIFDALVALVKDIKAKKNLTEITGENLPGLMTAIDGYDKLSDEAKAQGFHQSAGVFLGDMVEVFVNDEATVDA